MSTPLPRDGDFRFDPFGPDFDRDPYPVLALLREHDPIHWWAEAGAWVLTRHREVVQVMSDEARFSTDRRQWERYEPPAPEHRDHPVVRLMEGNLLAYEGAEHTRLRKLAAAALTRRAVRGLEPLMRTLIDELLDRVAAAGSCEFVEDVASVYPATVVARLLGIAPNSDRERRFKALADNAVASFNPVSDEASKLRALHAGAQQVAEVEALMEEKRARPGDDLMSELIRAEEDGDRFTPQEIVATIIAILVAGSETTANSMSFGLLELLRRPDQLALFRDEPSVRANAVYEMIRYQMPGRFLNRYPKVEVDLDGHRLLPGQLVLCSVASAQRDPALLDDPDRFDITRIPKDSSSFGIGRHFCLGAQLARLELEISLSRVLERLPDLQLDCAEEDLVYRSNPAVRGLEALPLTYRTATR